MKYILILLFAAWAVGLHAQDQELTTIVKVGQPVPEFSFQDENGKQVSVSDLKGNVVLITFFATWCPPCRKELPHIQTEIYDKYKNKANFKLLIFGREHSLAEVNDFKKAQNFTMPFYSDKDKSIYSKMASKYIPRNFLVDETGKVIFTSVGFEQKDFDKLKKTIGEKLK